MYTITANNVGSWTIFLNDKAVAFAFTEGMANRIVRLLNSEDLLGEKNNASIN